ncbi:hypothetical protein L0337_03455 [candidate division KSB1 bacterium]|nr:hypothetical protein [candidate division KSB1 bacterium]
METKNSTLDQVLETIDDFAPDELDLIEKRLASARKKKNGSKAPDGRSLSGGAQIPALPAATRDIFAITFDEYLAMSDEERDAIQEEAYANHLDWIDQMLKLHHAKWILVCGRKVIESGPTWENYPTDEKLQAIGEQYGLIPFVFAAAPMIEESDWAALSYNNFYPSLPIIVANKEQSPHDLVDNGLAIHADFDTGSPDVLLNYEQLLEQSIVKRQRLVRFNTRFHLGHPFDYYPLPVLMGVITEGGKLISEVINVLCVRRWVKSPFRLPNPSRQALVGRNTRIKLELQIKLDGRRRVTQILDD